MLWNESWEFLRVDVGKVATGAEIARGAGEPDEATASVQKERCGLWGCAETEGDRVASIAVREDLGFGEGRAGYGALEVAGSG